jgi:hypothetical protein
MTVRGAVAADAEAIEAVEAAAFGRPDEAALAARLRADGAARFATRGLSGFERQALTARPGRAARRPSATTRFRPPCLAA